MRSNLIFEENFLDILREIFAYIAVELLRIMPKILLMIVIFILAFVTIKILNAFLRKTLRLAKIDELFSRFSGISPPFSLERAIIFLADIGIILIVFYSLVNLFLEPRYVQMVNDGIYYSARIVSIVAITTIIFAIFNAIVSRIRVDPRLKTYTLVIVLLLITAMLIDITALSSEVKGSLTLGLSIGVGIAIGAFAIWFFFHEYLDAYFKIKTHEKGDENRER